MLKGHSGLVLAGGGARGAYEVGVIMGVAETLENAGYTASPFKIFTGTSVGAINAAFMAAHADTFGTGTTKLQDIWMSLEWSSHLGFSWRRALSIFRGKSRPSLGSIADASGLQSMIENSIPWDRLSHLTDSGHLDALVVAALQIYSGQTTLFAQLADHVDFSPTKDPRRRLVRTSVAAEHVLASSAIPFLFPPQEINGRWYCDGSIRFNTPISPAIRCGAERLMVVGVRKTQLARTIDKDEPAPGFGTILGKLLNALMLDPVSYDLQVLRRLNRFIEVTNSVLDNASKQAVEKVFVETRGNAYREIDLLVFSPSQDLGQMAAEVVLNDPDRFGRSMTERWLLRRLAREDAVWEHDLASYLIFDSEYTSRLIKLGHRDALNRTQDIRNFFIE